MSHLIEEQLSALFDGELPIEEEGLLFRRLGQDTEYRAVLARYGLISEFLLSARVDTAALQIGDRVRAELDDAELDDAELDDEVVHSGSSYSPAGFRKGLIGAGIAASVAMLALITLVNIDGGPGYGFVAQDNRADGQVIEPARLTGYLVSHVGFSSAVSRRVMDSHIINQPRQTAAWTFRTLSNEP